MDQLIKKGSVANYSKVIYHIEPNPSLISMTVKFGTGMALRLSSGLCYFHFPLALTDLPVATTIVP